MKLYTCAACNNLLFFENTICLKCNHKIGFDPAIQSFITLEKIASSEIWQDVKNAKVKYRQCANAQHESCNWLIPESSGGEFCEACQMNRTIPRLSETNVGRWRRIEAAKHRLIYSLKRLNLPLIPKTINHQTGIAFDFLAEINEQEKVLTGHCEGVITLNVEEADEAERVKSKLDLGERYRTLLGHFRHEIGHYYWDVFVRDKKVDHEQLHGLFGDESLPYSDALKKYYDEGPKENWADNFISPYATSHPWEDWAETWSHYLHLMDTLETAYYFGIGVHPNQTVGISSLDATVDRDPYKMKKFDDIFQMWIPLTFAVNNLNRSMGHNDFYPFVVPSPVVNKLAFIHDVCLTYRY